MEIAAYLIPRTPEGCAVYAAAFLWLFLHFRDRRIIRKNRQRLREK